MTYHEADIATAQIEKAYVKAVTESYDVALKDIERKIADIYAKYAVDGKLAIEAMKKADKENITRLQTLVESINEDINTLNRGKPQQLSGVLTDVYELNFEVPLEEIKKRFDNLNWTKPNRQQVYQAALSDMGKIGLEFNAQAVRFAVRRDIVTAIIQGESIKDLSKRIKKSLEGNANDTVRIARTETTRIVNTARQDAFDTAAGLGVEMRKIWVSTNDGRTRPSHRALQGEEVKIDKAFSNGLQRPGDPSAPASEVINCRCTMRSRIVSIDGTPIEELTT
jgi:SPP1 gp7 family putative phage head morphogenesis protein